MHLNERKELQRPKFTAGTLTLLIPPILDTKPGVLAVDHVLELQAAGERSPFSARGGAALHPDVGNVFRANFCGGRDSPASVALALTLVVVY